MAKKYFLMAALALIVAGEAYFLWIRPRRTVLSADSDLKSQYERILRADRDGGATPQATLALFIEALRIGDAEQASRYFLPDITGSRRQWLDQLKQIKKRGLFSRMADDMKRQARPRPPAYPDDAGFELFNEDGTVGVFIDMERNPYTGLWKIERI